MNFFLLSQKKRQKGLKISTPTGTKAKHNKRQLFLGLCENPVSCGQVQMQNGFFPYGSKKGGNFIIREGNPLFFYYKGCRGVL